MRAVSQNQAEAVGLSAPTAVARTGWGRLHWAGTREDWDPEVERSL